MYLNVGNMIGWIINSNHCLPLLTLNRTQVLKTSLFDYLMLISSKLQPFFCEKIINSVFFLQIKHVLMQNNIWIEKL